MRASLMKAAEPSVATCCRTRVGVPSRSRRGSWRAGYPAARMSSSTPDPTADPVGRGPTLMKRSAGCAYKTRAA
jgi:hypothetical protein